MQCTNKHCFCVIKSLRRCAYVIRVCDDPGNNLNIFLATFGLGELNIILPLAVGRAVLQKALDIAIMLKYDIDIADFGRSCAIFGRPLNCD